MNKVEEAKECYNDCILQKRKVYGDNDLSVGKTLHDLGCLLIKVGDRVGALEAFKYSLMIRKKKLGLQNTETVATILKIGEVYFDNQEQDAALKSFEQASSLLLEINGDNDIEFAICNKNAGTIYCRE